jgi:hypothetical protein
VPNWCWNELSVKGPGAEITRLLESVKGETAFDFDRVIPYPDRFRRLDEEAREWEARQEALPEGQKMPWSAQPTDGFNQGGYEWRVERWGTKWPARGPDYSRPDDIPVQRAEEGAADIQFHTAWSPPIPVVTALGERFPALAFNLHYHEPGVGFEGRLRVVAGRVEEDATWDDDPSWRLE